MSAPVIRLAGLAKAYNVGTPVETEVLHGLDLSLEQGEFAALIGPSGSGKSTLLNIIGLLERPTGGLLSIDGRDTARLSEAELTQLRGRSIGFVFQFHHLLPAFSALENVMMPAIVARGAPDDEAEATALQLLDAVGLKAHARKKPGELSGGQQQRVAIARALALKPRLILADEPTGNLDTARSREIMDLLAALNRDQGITVVMVTHEADMAAYAHRTVRLVDGLIASDERRASGGQP